jgi:hypothetical protein
MYNDFHFCLHLSVCATHVTPPYLSHLPSHIEHSNRSVSMRRCLLVVSPHRLNLPRIQFTRNLSGTHSRTKSSAEQKRFLAGGSCEHACGGSSLSPNSDCYCDKECIKNGDCCHDAVQLCSGHVFTDEPTMAGVILAAVRCRPNSDCYCDEECMQNGDCCHDAVQFGSAHVLS